MTDQEMVHLRAMVDAGTVYTTFNYDNGAAFISATKIGFNPDGIDRIYNDQHGFMLKHPASIHYAPSKQALDAVVDSTYTQIYLPLHNNIIDTDLLLVPAEFSTVDTKSLKVGEVFVLETFTDGHGFQLLTVIGNTYRSVVCTPSSNNWDVISWESENGKTYSRVIDRGVDTTDTQESIWVENYT